ncbi:small basic family protein [Fusibacter bizertensis]|uniref:small basic family protein n=1 Tax=Fusibacter bizertensis TaxID=1488331 RepID=UPI00315DB665
MIALLGILLGILLGLYIPFEFSTISSLYISVGILAAIDSIIGALRASLEGKFDGIIFISGFFVNAILAILLSYLGDKLGVPIYYAAIFVFGTRLFNNIGAIRRYTIDRYRGK